MHETSKRARHYLTILFGRLPSFPKQKLIEHANSWNSEKFTIANALKNGQLPLSSLFIGMAINTSKLTTLNGCQEALTGKF